MTPINCQLHIANIIKVYDQDKENAITQTRKK